MGLRASLHSWWTQKKLDMGLMTYGRQGSGGSDMDVKVPHHATISIRVIRANGDVEDRGVVSEGTVELTPEQLAMLDQAARK